MCEIGYSDEAVSSRPYSPVFFSSSSSTFDVMSAIDEIYNAFSPYIALLEPLGLKRYRCSQAEQGTPTSRCEQIQSYKENNLEGVSCRNSAKLSALESSLRNRRGEGGEHVKDSLRTTNATLPMSKTCLRNAQDESNSNEIAAAAFAAEYLRKGPNTSYIKSLFKEKLADGTLSESRLSKMSDINAVFDHWKALVKTIPLSVALFKLNNTSDIKTKDTRAVSRAFPSSEEHYLSRDGSVKKQQLMPALESNGVFTATSKEKLSKTPPLLPAIVPVTSAGSKNRIAGQKTVFNPAELYAALTDESTLVVSWPKGSTANAVEGGIPFSDVELLLAPILCPTYPNRVKEWMRSSFSHRATSLSWRALSDYLVECQGHVAAAVSAPPIDHIKSGDASERKPDGGDDTTGTNVKRTANSSKEGLHRYTTTPVNFASKSLGFYALPLQSLCYFDNRLFTAEMRQRTKKLESRGNVVHELNRNIVANKILNKRNGEVQTNSSNNNDANKQEDDGEGENGVMYKRRAKPETTPPLVYYNYIALCSDGSIISFNPITLRPQFTIQFTHEDSTLGLALTGASASQRGGRGEVSNAIQLDGGAFGAVSGPPRPATAVGGEQTDRSVALVERLSSMVGKLSLAMDAFDSGIGNSMRRHGYKSHFQSSPSVTSNTVVSLPNSSSRLTSLQAAPTSFAPFTVLNTSAALVCSAARAQPRIRLNAERGHLWVVERDNRIYVYDVRYKKGCTRTGNVVKAFAIYAPGAVLRRERIRKRVLFDPLKTDVVVGKPPLGAGGGVQESAVVDIELQQLEPPNTVLETSMSKNKKKDDAVASPTKKTNEGLDATFQLNGTSQRADQLSCCSSRAQSAKQNSCAPFSPPFKRFLVHENRSDEQPVNSNCDETLFPNSCRSSKDKNRPRSCHFGQADANQKQRSLSLASHVRITAIEPELTVSYRSKFPSSGLFSSQDKTERVAKMSPLTNFEHGLSASSTLIGLDSKLDSCGSEDLQSENELEDTLNETQQRNKGAGSDANEFIPLAAPGRDPHFFCGFDNGSIAWYAPSLLSSTATKPVQEWRPHKAEVTQLMHCTDMNQPMFFGLISSSLDGTIVVTDLEKILSKVSFNFCPDSAYSYSSCRPSQDLGSTTSTASRARSGPSSARSDVNQTSHGTTIPHFGLDSSSPNALSPPPSSRSPRTPGSPTRHVNSGLKRRGVLFFDCTRPHVNSNTLSCLSSLTGDGCPNSTGFDSSANIPSAWSFNASLLAAAGAGRRVCVYSGQSRRSVTSLLEHQSVVQDLRFNDALGQLLVLTADSIIYVYDVRTLRVIQRLDCNGERLYNSDPVRALLVDKQNSALVAMGGTANLYVPYRICSDSSVLGVPVSQSKVFYFQRTPSRALLVDQQLSPVASRNEYSTFESASGLRDSTLPLTPFFGGGSPLPTTHLTLVPAYIICSSGGLLFGLDPFTGSRTFGFACGVALCKNTNIGFENVARGSPVVRDADDAAKAQQRLITERISRKTTQAKPPRGPQNRGGDGGGTGDSGTATNPFDDEAGIFSSNTGDNTQGDANLGERSGLCGGGGGTARSSILDVAQDPDWQFLFLLVDTPHTAKNIKRDREMLRTKSFMGALGQPSSQSKPCHLEMDISSQCRSGPCEKLKMASSEAQKNSEKSCTSAAAPVDKRNEIGVYIEVLVAGTAETLRLYNVEDYRLRCIGVWQGCPKSESNSNNKSISGCGDDAEEDNIGGGTDGSCASNTNFRDSFQKCRISDEEQESDDNMTSLRTRAAGEGNGKASRISSLNVPSSTCRSHYTCKEDGSDHDCQTSVCSPICAKIPPSHHPVRGDQERAVAIAKEHYVLGGNDVGVLFFRCDLFDQDSAVSEREICEEFLQLLYLVPLRYFAAIDVTKRLMNQLGNCNTPLHRSKQSGGTLLESLGCVTCITTTCKSSTGRVCYSPIDHLHENSPVAQNDVGVNLVVAGTSSGDVCGLLPRGQRPLVAFYLTQGYFYYYYHRGFYFNPSYTFTNVPANERKEAAGGYNYFSFLPLHNRDERYFRRLYSQQDSSRCSTQGLVPSQIFRINEKDHNVGQTDSRRFESFKTEGNLPRGTSPESPAVSAEASQGPQPRRSMSPRFSSERGQYNTFTLRKMDSGREVCRENSGPFAAHTEVSSTRSFSKSEVDVNQNESQKVNSPALGAAQFFSRSSSFKLRNSAVGGGGGGGLLSGGKQTSHAKLLWEQMSKTLIEKTKQLANYGFDEFRYDQQYKQLRQTDSVCTIVISSAELALQEFLGVQTVVDFLAQENVENNKGGLIFCGIKYYWGNGFLIPSCYVDSVGVLRKKKMKGNSKFGPSAAKYYREKKCSDASENNFTLRSRMHSGCSFGGSDNNNSPNILVKQTESNVTMNKNPDRSKNAGVVYIAITLGGGQVAIAVLDPISAGALRRHRTGKGNPTPTPQHEEQLTAPTRTEALMTTSEERGTPQPSEKAANGSCEKKSDNAANMAAAILFPSLVVLSYFPASFFSGVGAVTAVADVYTPVLINHTLDSGYVSVTPATDASSGRAAPSQNSAVAKAAGVTSSTRSLERPESKRPNIQDDKKDFANFSPEGVPSRRISLANNRRHSLFSTDGKGRSSRRLPLSSLGDIVRADSVSPVTTCESDEPQVNVICFQKSLLIVTGDDKGYLSIFTYALPHVPPEEAVNEAETGTAECAASTIYRLSNNHISFFRDNKNRVRDFTAASPQIIGTINRLIQKNYRTQETIMHLLEQAKETDRITEYTERNSQLTLRNSVRGVSSTLSSFKLGGGQGLRLPAARSLTTNDGRSWGGGPGSQNGEQLQSGKLLLADLEETESTLLPMRTETICERDCGLKAAVTNASSVAEMKKLVDSVITLNDRGALHLAHVLRFPCSISSVVIIPAQRSTQAGLEGECAITGQPAVTRVGKSLGREIPPLLPDTSALRAVYPDVFIGFENGTTALLSLQHLRLLWGGAQEMRRPPITEGATNIGQQAGSQVNSLRGPTQPHLLGRTAPTMSVQPWSDSVENIMSREMLRDGFTIVPVEQHQFFKSFYGPGYQRSMDKGDGVGERGRGGEAMRTAPDG